MGITARWHLIANWALLTSDKMILSRIKGFKIPFFVPPFQNKIKIQSWSNHEAAKIRSQVKILLEKGAIHKCSPVDDQFVSNIFIPPKSDGSVRLILNIKKLNELMHADHFKLEDDCFS